MPPVEVSWVDAALTGGGLVLGGGGWLFSRLWSARGHEIRNVGQTAANASALIQNHIESDAEVHRELTEKLGTIQGDVGEIKGYLRAMSENKK